MKIRHAYDAITLQEDEDRFVAYDETEQQIGTARVSASTLQMLCPAQPYHICVSAEAEDAAIDALLGAATARALRLSRMRPDLKSRIYCECEPGDEARMDALMTLGYKNDDGLVRMKKDLRRMPAKSGIPDRLTVVRDLIADELEGQFFLERYNAMFSRERDAAWLRGLQSLPDFERILLVAADGLAGEIVIWTTGNTGVLGILQTTPRYQRKGVATHLLALAEQTFLDRGCDTVQFDVWLRLRPAVRFAEKNRFAPEETLLRYPGINP